LFMKRFFTFLLFVLVLSITVALLQVWKLRREGGLVRNPLSGLFGGGNNADGGGRRVPERYTVAEGPRINVNDVDVLAAMSRQRIILAKAVVPSVVSITTSKSVRSQPYENDPLFRFFHQGARRSSPGEVTTQKALGSGVIVSKEGHIVTNNHVIEEMDEIEVELSDGTRKQARLIGTDADTDIAVLKIDTADAVPLPFGNSDVVEVGETVMAVGNPYGFEESVTQGIISAKGRHGSENVSDLFQTDAAINPGNSGGPLVNVRGELIGINEAIYSQSGGWQGVGFAIPSLTVRRVMDGILRTGRVIKSYLGVNLQDTLTPAVAEQRGLPSNKGALVADVMAGSPAEAAHLQAGDFIQKFNGKTVGDLQDLRQFVSEVDIDKTVPVELFRAGKTITVEVQIREKPPTAQLARQQQRRGLQQQPVLPGGPSSLAPPTSSDDDDGLAGSDSGALAGVQVAELTGPIARHLRLPGSLQGMVVVRIDANSPAADKLQVGDVIEQVNRKPVSSLADYRRLVNGLSARGTVTLSIVRDRSRTLVVIEPN
jgi:serine protease Do